MNIYLVVEGEVGEKRVYTKWVPIVNPCLQIVQDIEEVTSNCVYIVSGGGMPQYFDTITAGIEDVAANPQFDRIVVAVDSEDMTYSEKYEEVEKHILSVNNQINYRIIVQHFCLEAWALGNKVTVRKNPQDAKLREYIKLYNVRQEDPEGLPGYLEFNRARFAENYLRKALNDKYRNLTYNKSNPGALLNNKYFERVKDRYINTGHISSFDDFLTAFI